MTTIVCHARDEATALIVVAGDLDLDRVDALRGEGLARLDDGRNLVVDLIDVSFIDCAALGCLVGLRETATARGASLTLLDPSLPVIRLLDLTGLAATFPNDRVVSTPI